MQTDIAYRLGGDEFVIFYPTMYPDIVCDSKSRQIRDSINEVISIDSNRIRLTCSIGCAVYKGSTVSFSSLYSKADSALIQAKEQGKNTYVVDKTMF